MPLRRSERLCVGDDERRRLEPHQAQQHAYPFLLQKGLVEGGRRLEQHAERSHAEALHAQRRAPERRAEHE